VTKQERIDKIVKALTAAAQDAGLDGIGVVFDHDGHARLLMIGDSDEVADIAQSAADVYGYDEDTLVMERGEDDRLN
jgi:hypothetical protein